jgi:hypothetical protein
MLMILGKDFSHNNNKINNKLFEANIYKKIIAIDFGQCGKSGTPRESLSINPIGKWPWMASLGVNFIDVSNAALKFFTSQHNIAYFETSRKNQT